MSQGYFPKSYGNSGGYGQAITQGFNNANNNAKNTIALMTERDKQRKEYQDALYKKQTFEMADKKFKHDIALKHLHDVSSMDKQKLENMKQFQPEVYRELVKSIKDGIPSAIDENGDIITQPQYKVQAEKLKLENAELKQRIQNGTASEDDKIAYVRGTSLGRIHEEAVKLASTGKNADKWDNASDEAKTAMVASASKALFQSYVNQLSPQNDIAPQLSGQENPSPIVGALTKGLGALAQGAGNRIASALLGNQGQPPVQQGQAPVESNRSKYSSLWS